MASKRMLNRLYWALVNALSDKDVQNIEVLENSYRRALDGMPDSSLHRWEPALEDALLAIEEIHGPAGVRQVDRPRPRWVREHVDSLRENAAPF